MTLYEFVEMAIDTMGGVIIQLEYALCTAMIPDMYTDYFQGQSELLLAFDYEVANENPESEFVTYGSFIFDTIMQIARTTAITTQRYVRLDRLEIYSPEEKLKKYLQMESGIIDIISTTPKMGIWCLFNFCVHYVSDERYEETESVWLNMINGEIDDTITKDSIFYDSDPVTDIPYIKPKSMKLALKVAQDYINTVSDEKSIKYANSTQLEHEIQRITNYYDEMINENRKRIRRKNIAEERVNEIVQKELALEREKNKQIYEIQNKLLCKTDVSLENTTMYHIPLIELITRVSYRRESYDAVFYYDNIFKRIIRQSDKINKK